MHLWSWPGDMSFGCMSTGAMGPISLSESCCLLPYTGLPRLDGNKWRETERWNKKEIEFSQQGIHPLHRALPPLYPALTTPAGLDLSPSKYVWVSWLVTWSVVQHLFRPFHVMSSSGLNFSLFMLLWFLWMLSIKTKEKGSLFMAACCKSPTSIT